MPRGRKPKPLHLRSVEGSFRQDRHNANPPKPKPIEPERPTWLRGQGRKKWDELIAILRDMGILTQADGDILAQYCELWRLFCDHRAKVKLKPAQKIEIGRRLQSLGSELGLSPTARQRITIQPQSNTEDASFLDQPIGNG